MVYTRQVGGSIPSSCTMDPRRSIVLLVPHVIYANGQTLVEDGVVMTIGDYTNGVGQTVTTGQGRIATGSAGATGQAIFLSNTSLSSDFFCALSVQLDSICCSECDDPDCYDFGELDGKKLFPDDTYTEDGSTLTVRPYITPGGKTLDGILTQNGSPLGLHQGSEALLVEAGVRVDGDCFASLKVSYRELKDGVNLQINGVLVKADSFNALAGTTVAGVSISADGDILMLEGIIESVVIGGVELVLDHLCYERCPMDCIDFEDVDPGLVGASLMEDNVLMTVSPLAPGPVETHLRIGLQQGAGHSGQDVSLRNVRLQFEIPCAEEIALHFGQYEPGVELAINGDLRIVKDIGVLDGETVGGVVLGVTTVPVPGGVTGLVEFDGIVQNLVIGGESLWVDHICFDRCTPIDVGDLRHFVMADESPGQWRLSFEVAVSGPVEIGKTVQRSAGLGAPQVWSNHAATFTPHPTKPDTFNVTLVVPKADARNFVRVKAVLP